MPKKHAGGRPPIPINWEEFDKLCALQCTEVEIASWFNCSVDTIARALKKKWRLSFAEYFDQKAARGRISLRRKQFEMAQSGNVTMLIWLGKQVLGQKEKLEHSGDKEKPIRVIIEDYCGTPDSSDT